MGGYLPALSVQPPPNPADQLTRAIQLKSLLGEQQLQQIQIQNAQADQQAYRAANDQWKPNEQGQLDPNDFVDLMRKNGATGQTVLKLQQMQLEREEKASLIRKNNTTAAKEQADLQSQKMEKVSGDIDTIKSLPADQYPAALSKLLQSRVQDGTFTSQEAQGYAQVPQSELDGLQKHILGEKAWNDNQAKLAEADMFRQRAALAKMQAAKVPEEKNPTEASLAQQAVTPGPNQATAEAALKRLDQSKQAAKTPPDPEIKELRKDLMKSQLEKAQEPTADEQRRADLARNMNENLDQISDLITRRPDLFGPMAGRMTQLRARVGTSDPDIAKLEAVKEYLGMASVGAHAMRNAQHVETAANAILNNFTNSPKAMAAAIETARQSTATFLQDEMRRKNRALVNESGGGPSTTTPAAAPATKTLSRAMIQKAAKDHGVSEAEAERQARAAGYNVQ